MLLNAANIPFTQNRWNNTPDPRRADFDYQIAALLIECKANFAARETGNIALETDILKKSKAHYFLIAFPFPGGWHGQMVDRHDIEGLQKATTLTWRGREPKYQVKQTGQWEDTKSMLIPTKDLLMYGVPVDQFIKQLKQEQLIF